MFCQGIGDSEDEDEIFGPESIEESAENLFGSVSDPEPEGGPLAYRQEADDVAKVAYVNEALSEDVEFEDSRPLDEDLLRAVEWAKGKTPQEMMDERENSLKAIEQLGEQLVSSQKVRKW